MVIRDVLDCRVGERSAYLDSTSGVRKSILLKRAAIGSEKTLEQPKKHTKIQHLPLSQHYTATMQQHKKQTK